MCRVCVCVVWLPFGCRLCDSCLPVVRRLLVLRLSCGRLVFVVCLCCVSCGRLLFCLSVVCCLYVVYRSGGVRLSVARASLVCRLSVGRRSLVLCLSVACVVYLLAVACSSCVCLVFG